MKPVILINYKQKSKIRIPPILEFFSIYEQDSPFLLEISFHFVVLQTRPDQYN